MCSRLELEGNPLGPATTLPSCLASCCPRLRHLLLGSTGLVAVPPPLLCLRDLRHLDLSNHGRPERAATNLLTIATLQPSRLQGLARLEVTATCLTHLPSLAHLPALAILQAGRNQLWQLPDLPASLVALIVPRNRLLTLPSLAHLPRLRHLLAAHNSIGYLGSVLP